MFCLTSIIEDINKDFMKSQYKNAKILSRRFVVSRQNVILVNLYQINCISEISILIPDCISKDMLNTLPKWKGMEERLSSICDDNKMRQFLTFRQSEECDIKIFLLVLQDILDSIENQDNRDVITSINNVLVKWNTFFQFDKNYVLSDNVQQGLYGELYILEKMVDIKGEDAINYWTGCNAETHDFYCGKDAAEVKSSSEKGPDKVKISNEYQLDDTGLLGRLYLLYLKMKKSEVDGEVLPDIVERISDKLGQGNRLCFYDKLLKVGYLYQMPELYTIHFRTREENCYTIEEGFPRITTKSICKGVGAVEYVVSLDACDSFQITIESFYKGVDL